MAAVYTLMSDPFYMIMLMEILGKGYLVWDRNASIEFLKPGKTELCAKFHVSDSVLEDIHSKTNDGSPYISKFGVDVTDTAGEVVAKVDKTIYRKSSQNKEQL